MRTVIAGGTLLTPDQELHDHDLILEDGKISDVRPTRTAQNDPRIDARGLWVTPGLIDIHVHGGQGNDAMDATPEALQGMAGFLAAHGVTSFLATTITAPSSAIAAAIENVNQCLGQEGGAQLLGVHLEGPYLSGAYRGAQPEKHLRPPAPEEDQAWLAVACVRLITLAPELEGAFELIQRGAAQGIEFALGHSAADYDTVVAAAEHGLRQATHTFNGMRGLHHRRPGAVGCVLTDDRIYAQVIADGIHLHPAIAKLVVRAKGIDRTILITDAIRAAGLQDGQYDLGGQTVVVQNGVARAANGSLAGSTLTMDAALRNVMQFCGLSFPQAVAMATRVPAEALGLAHKGRLVPGADADITLFNQALEVQKTLVNGKLVYEKHRS